MLDVDEKNSALKGARGFWAHCQGQAAAAAQRAAEEAAEAANTTCEASKALVSEHSERQGSLAQDFQKWSHQAQEEAARVLQAHEAAVTDMLKTMDRHRWQTKEDALKTREELMTVMKSNTKAPDAETA